MARAGRPDFRGVAGQDQVEGALVVVHVRRGIHGWMSRRRPAGDAGEAGQAGRGKRGGGVHDERFAARTVGNLDRRPAMTGVV